MVQELMLEPANVSGDYCVAMLTWGPQELLAHSLTELMGLGVGWAEAGGGGGGLLSETCWCDSVILPTVG